MRGCGQLAKSLERSGELDEVAVVLGPIVLGAVGQQHDPLRRQCLRCTGVVGHEYDGAEVTAQRVENLFA